MSDLRQRPVKDSYSEEPEDDDHSISESEYDVEEESEEQSEEQSEEEEEEDEEAINDRIAREDGDNRFISPLDILRVLFALSLFVGAFSYFLTSESFLLGYRPWFTNVPAVLSYFVRLPPTYYLPTRD